MCNLSQDKNLEWTVYVGVVQNDDYISLRRN